MNPGVTSQPRRVVGQVGRGLGVVACLAGLWGAGGLFTIFLLPYLRIGLDGVRFVGEGSFNAPTFSFWIGALVILAFLVGYSAWSRRVKMVVVLAIFLLILARVSFMMSSQIWPFAILTLLSAVFLALGGLSSIPMRNNDIKS